LAYLLRIKSRFFFWLIVCTFLFLDLTCEVKEQLAIYIESYIKNPRMDEIPAILDIRI